MGMGCFRESGAVTNIQLPSRRELPPEITGPVWDTSAMDMDQLMQYGLIEAQHAAVKKVKSERVRHLYTSRGLLLAALRRCGSDDQALQAHLLAILLKLGEDAATVQACMAEAEREREAKQGQSQAQGNNSQQLPMRDSSVPLRHRFHPHHQLTGVREEEDSDKDGSEDGDEADANLSPLSARRHDIQDDIKLTWNYEEMRESLLDSDYVEAKKREDVDEDDDDDEDSDEDGDDGEDDNNKAEVARRELLTGEHLAAASHSPVRIGCSGEFDAEHGPPLVAGDLIAPPEAAPPPPPPPPPPPGLGAARPRSPSRQQARSPSMNALASRSSSASGLSTPGTRRSSEASNSTSSPSPAYAVAGSPSNADGMAPGHCFSQTPLGGLGGGAGGSGSALAGTLSTPTPANNSSDWIWPSDPRSAGHTRQRSNPFSSPGQTAADVDTFSLAPSLVPSNLGSMPPSPCIGTPSMMRTPPTASRSGGIDAAHHIGGTLHRSDSILVKILNGVSGEEEARFVMPVNPAFSERDVLNALDKQCQERTGQMLSGLKWLSPVESGRRFQRRKCDIQMVEEIFQDPVFQLRGAAELTLCIIPQRPPTEMPVAAKVRVKDLSPSRVAIGTTTPVHMKVETSVLEPGHEYSVAFTDQWSNMTYTVEATLLSDLKGVTLVLPWLMLMGNKQGHSSDGLYDAYLVIDSESRSENRKTLTVDTSESEMSSSSTAMSAFVPIR